jgi:predicted phage baseplate assembly protein
MSACKGNCAGTCGCCSGTQAATPRLVENRPGLSSIRYRAGEHADFKSTLLARLSGSHLAALRLLRTRDDEDFTIALIDSFAVMADVLTFYQERIANESYLRTAVERRSILELARLIGYELRPGVAAETQLAFTIEDTPGAFLRAANPSAPLAAAAPETAPVVALGIGTKVQSIPGPGETAQMFETVEPIDARAGWNAIRPRLTKPQDFSEYSATINSVYLTGVTHDVKKGDRVVTLPSPTVRIVREATVDAANNLTRVDFTDSPLTTIQQPAVIDPVPGQLPWSEPYLRGPLSLFIAYMIWTAQWREADLSTIVAREKWDPEELMTAVAKLVAASNTTGSAMSVFRQRAAAFGHTAPNWNSLPAAMRYRQKVKVVGANNAETDEILEPAYPALGWEANTLETDASTSGNLRYIWLDHQYEQIAPGGWIGLEAGTSRPVRIDTVDQLSRSAYTISGKTTRVRVNTTSLSSFPIRTTTIHVQSEALPLAPLPITQTVTGSTLVCDRMLLGVRVGQIVAIAGERADVPGVWISEAMEIVESNIDRGLSVLKFKSALSYPLVRKTVTINANVARATHGETVTEILGAGDATQSFQRFTLRQPPLTHVSADTDTGTATTLEVRVNDLLWTEVTSFYGHGPDERIYITRLDDDGKTTVIFGDGRTGARLPTGENNVTAKYRRGIGSAGLVKANQISQLMSRPLGLKGATNPVASQNAGDRESLSEARQNASLTALTLGRVVSLRDYEDFSRAFAGIAKADATWAWSGEQRHVLVTVAGPNGSTIANGSDLHTNLIGALRKFGDPHTPIHLVSYVPRWFRLQARVKVGAEYRSDKVFTEVEAKLREAFSFDARSFGQAVGRSEVLAVMHRVDGVIAVDIDQFYPAEQATPDIKPRIGAVRPSAMAPARLVTIDPRPVKLEVMP